MPRSKGGGPPTQRQLRVGEEIRHALVRVFQRGDLRDPALTEASLTVTEVRVSPDLKGATAFVTPLGGTAEADLIAACRRAAPFLRGQMARDLNLRFAPSLTFAADRSFERASQIDDLLRDPHVAQDLTPIPNSDADNG